jgi:Cu(I)/Ag(I) efflux system membrane fusion protein
MTNGVSKSRFGSFERRRVMYRIRDMARTRRIVTRATTLGLLLIAALLVTSCGRGGDEAASTEAAVAPGTIWTCSMHPQVRSDKPGNCPICGMELIPVQEENEASEAGERVLEVSEAGRELMDIQTTPVRRMEVSVEVGLVGKVAYDEERVARISAWVPGRVDALFVDYVGYEVESGEPMVELYGPELLAAQHELLESASAYKDAVASGKPRLVESAQGVLDAVRERMSLWGLSDEQIREVEQRGTAEPRVTIEAPTSGTVVAKNIDEGAYVMTGQTLFTIADLSTVWVELEAYETDLPWLAVGQPVEFKAAAFPGRTFDGHLSFVEPLVNPKTRTVKVRAEVPNEDGSLKPDMFVKATVHSLKAEQGARPPLVIPASAPLLTGKRAVVYVELEGTDRPSFEGREVVLGPRAGDYYIVDSGLEEGDRVVSEGAFKIDSALQIRAKPSMMNPEHEGAASAGHAGHQHDH